MEQSILDQFTYIESNQELHFQQFSEEELNSIQYFHDIKSSDQVHIKRHFTADLRCECGGLIQKRDDDTVCIACGIVENIVGYEDSGSNSSMSSYNTSSESANPIRVVGPGGQQFQKRLVCDTGDYSKTRMRDTLVQMQQLTQAYKKCQFPTNIVKEAAMLYYKIQTSGEIKRGDVRIGAMMICLMKICCKYGIYKKRTMFAEIGKINMNDLSEGEKLLNRLISDGKIHRDEFEPLGIQIRDENRIQGYLMQHFITLGIPLPPDIYQDQLGSGNHPKVQYSDKLQYYMFVKRLVDFTVKFKVAENNVQYSKCAGAIYILSSRCPELGITPELISSECKISKSTFKKFYNVINDLLTTTDEKKQRLKAKLVHLFHKYGVPTSADANQDTVDETD